MQNLNLLAIDTSKLSFALDYADAGGRAIFRKEVKRDRLLTVIAQMPKAINCHGSLRRLAPLGQRISKART